MKISFTSSILALWCVTQTFAVECTPGGHSENPCEDDVDSPEFQITPSPTVSPTTMMPSSPPTNTPTSKPSPTPTSSPTTTPTGAPSSIPSDAPSLIPSDAPSNAPTPAPTVGCAIQDGVFGDIDSEVFRTIEYGYEVETTTSAEAIASDVLPLVESAVTNSILSELFAECAVRRKLRRRLEVTGVTQLPEDLVVDNVICGNVQEGNSCVVVSGALSLYATDAESASALEDVILEVIKANMEAGNFNDVDESVVRVTYTELESGPDGSQSANDGNRSIGDDDNSGVLIGSLVAAGVIMAAVVGVAYRKRKNENETNDLGDATATELGAEQSMLSGDQSTMVSS